MDKSSDLKEKGSPGNHKTSATYENGCQSVQGIQMKEITPGGDKTRHLYEDLLEWEYGNTAYYSALAVLLFIAIDGLIIRGDVLRAQWGFVALAIALLPAIAEYLTPVILPWPMKFFITLSLILHIAGGIFEFYFTLYPVYDKIGHLVSSIAISLLIFVMLLILVGIIGIRISNFSVIIFIFISVLLFGVAWEYAELNIDTVAGSTYFVNFNDSLLDMLFNVIGTGYIVMNVHELLKGESLLDLYRRIIRWKT